MSHNKIFKIQIKLVPLCLLKSNNQRYKLLKTKPNDIIRTAACQNTADFVYSAYKFSANYKNPADEIINSILRRKR